MLFISSKAEATTDLSPLSEAKSCENPAMPIVSRLQVDFGLKYLDINDGRTIYGSSLSHVLHQMESTSKIVIEYHVPFLNFDDCAVGAILKKVIPGNLCLSSCGFSAAESECDKEPTLYAES